MGEASKIAEDLVHKFRTNTLTPVDGVNLCELLVSLGIENPKIDDEFSILLFMIGNKEKAYDYSSKALESSFWKNDKDIKRLLENVGATLNPDRFVNYNRTLVDEMMTALSEGDQTQKPVTITTLTCKRIDLFQKTVNSFLACCSSSDKKLIKKWLIVDDNSSSSDREEMKSLYPFMTFILKSQDQRGAAFSMNLIRNVVDTKYLFHIEDDWCFIRKADLISKCIKIVDSDPDIGQCLLNKNYGEVWSCNEIVGGKRKDVGEIRAYVHQYVPQEEVGEFVKLFPQNSKFVAYWKHYSFRVGLTKMSVLKKLGEYANISSTLGTERQYADRYNASGYKTAFLESIYCLHTGRKTWERNDKNIKGADELNEDEKKEETEEEREVRIKREEDERIRIEEEKEAEEERKKKEAEEERKRRMEEERKKAEQEEKNRKEIEQRKISLLPECTTFVVNLIRRKDRLDKVVANYPLEYKVFKAVDGAELIPNHQLCKIFEPNDFHWKRGMIGCALSHMKLWIDLLEDQKSDEYLVLEDDVTFANKFSAKLDHVKMVLEGRQWDVVFLGHSTYIDDPKNKLDKLPTVEMWSRSKSKALSMGGTFGYIISKSGAKKILDNISKVGMSNGIDWMMFLPDGMKNYYCSPHIVFSECFKGKKIDSDIQYDSSVMNINPTERLKVELEYWMKKTNSEGIEIDSDSQGEVFPVKIKKGRAQPQGQGATSPLARVGMQSIPPRFPSENVPCPEGQGTSKIIFSKKYATRESAITSGKILMTTDEKANTSKNWYSIGKYYFAVPDSLVSKDLILNGKYFNGNIDSAIAREADAEGRIPSGVQIQSPDENQQRNNNESPPACSVRKATAQVTEEGCSSPIYSSSLSLSPTSPFSITFPPAKSPVSSPPVSSPSLLKTLNIETFVVCPAKEQQYTFIKNNPGITNANVVSVPITPSFKILKLFENSTEEAKLPQFMSRIMGYIVILTEMVKTGKERCLVYDCLAKVKEQQIVSDGFDISFLEPTGMSFCITKGGAIKMLERFASHGVRYCMEREFKEELKYEEKNYVDMQSLTTLSCELDFRSDTRFHNEVLYWMNKTNSKGVRYIDESKTNFPLDPSSKIIYINCPVGKSVRIGRKDMLTNVILCNNIAILSITNSRPILWYSIADKFWITVPEPFISEDIEKEKCWSGLYLSPKRLF
jgi:GR25 family glycosyltransferase involved in LPS biosynthesis